MEALRIKDVELVTQEITADNMLSGNTDVEVEFTTLDCDPLVSGITSHGSANGASSADVTFLRLHNVDYPALNEHPSHPGWMGRMDIRTWERRERERERVVTLG